LAVFNLLATIDKSLENFITQTSSATRESIQL